MRPLYPMRRPCGADVGPARKWPCVRLDPPYAALIRERPAPGPLWRAAGRLSLQCRCRPRDAGSSRGLRGPLVHHASPPPLAYGNRSLGRWGPTTAGRRGVCSRRHRQPRTVGRPFIKWPKTWCPYTGRPLGPWSCTLGARSNDGQCAWSGSVRRPLRHGRRPCARPPSRSLPVWLRPRLPR
jgi:hypothetical protein